MADWDWTEKSTTAIHAVNAIAVYTNNEGDIVIRQQDPMGDDDSVIVIPRTQAKVLATAVRKEAEKKLD